MHWPLPPSVGIISMYGDLPDQLLKIVAGPLNQSVNKTIIILHNKLMNMIICQHLIQKNLPKYPHGTEEVV